MFQAQFGFHDSVVAAPSQPAALRAWGVHQNLFANGQARVAEDPKAVAAALAHPNTPLRRAVGSSDSFALDAGLPRVPAAKRARDAPQAKAKPRVAAAPVADRGKLDVAEAALRKLDDAWAREAAALQDRKDELDALIRAAKAAHAKRRGAAVEAVKAARAVYRKAGGEG